ncbi:glycosyltransferase [Aureibaculum sp. 2210JD6-5]|uniref:glycosyltransferase n=1 Tax=Aureibaculum sp. 2210JD6-5 TaxID=3103957 RepID=UPI002AADD5EE|nr:glycosyltransferase [Aureibaculum sp. 2210JD6-5]MDY7396936.1 glycosyltransferase [Aureibaculum sp. 2210JD6-5]
MLSFLYVIFILSVIAQVVFFYIFSKFSFSKYQGSNVLQLKISVVICARNEADNIERNIEKVLTQRYRDFEVIVVNDASTDGTLAILKQYQIRFKHLKIIDIEASNNYTGNKKKAITEGVNASKYDYILLTDADCEPASPYWMSEMASQFSIKKQIVLGYGAYKKIKGSFLNKLIRYETLLTAIQYFSYAKIGIPYMGVGRNLAYKKELFNKANGLENHANIKSGDDDLFVNQVATKQNTTVCFTKDSFTLSEPKSTFKSWLNQKRRHITTAKHYKSIHKNLLGIYYLSQISFWVLAIILLAFSLIGQMEILNVIVLILMRLLTQFIVVGNAAKKLNEKDLILWFPLLDIYLVFIQFGIFIANLNRKPQAW